jgi:lysozyme family protein
MTFDEAFDLAVDRVLDHEGGYVNSPNDPGGETKWGISKRSYPWLPIADLTRDDARRIYHDEFWRAVGAQDRHPAVAFQLFDFAVNSGIQTAVRAYQRALGVADDGHFGPVSATAAGSMSDADQVMRILAERLDFMTRLSNWPDAGKGWTRRVAQNLRYGAEDTK